MKKLILGLLIMITMFITGCDNNSGPFETKKENGILILYSNNKLAKGWLTSTIQDRSGNSVTISEIYFDKGLPAGDFTLRNLEGHIIAEAKGKWIASGTFEGTINNGYDETSKGIYSINSNYLINFEQYLSFPIKECLSTGEYNRRDVTIIKKDNMEREITYFYPNKQIKEKITQNENGYRIEIISFYENGQLETKQTVSEGVWFYKNGQMRKQTTIVGNITITQEWFENGVLQCLKETKEYATTKYYYAIYHKDEIMPQVFRYDKNGKEINIYINPDYDDKGLNISFTVYTKGFEDINEINELMKKVAPRELEEYMESHKNYKVEMN